MAGGFNGPQPVPGQPPRMMQPPLATSQPMPWDFSGGATTDQGMPGGENGRGPGGPFYQPSPFKFPSDPNDPRYQPGGDLYFDPSRSSEGPGGLTGHAQDPGYWQLGGNRGSGQPINQPNLGMADNPTAPVRQPGFVAPDPSQMAYTTGMGSLQSLGGGQLNQSGMVTLRAPDGSQTKAVPADQVAHWLSRGAVRV
jgi:hypothetical protein